jgi:hypothetical protein
MCKNKKIQRPFGAVLATALVGLLAAANPGAGLAQTSCNPGVGDSIGVLGPYNNNYVHVGQNATITSLVLFNSSFQVGGVEQICTATNVKTWIVYPDNSFQPVLFLNTSAFPNNLLNPGNNVQCSADGRCLPYSSTYQVKLTDIGQGLNFSTNWPPGFGSPLNLPRSGQANTVLFQYVAGASMIGNSSAIGQAGQSLGLTVLQPCVGITKNCATNCTPYGQPIAFSGIITNCSVLQASPSDGKLYITSVSDNPTANITYAATTFLGHPFPDPSDPVFGNVLQQGDSVAYSGSYQPTGNLCVHLTTRSR